tara:strand:+ start:3053 stop:4768 length:1716 start_codon:yes stop_codon:yes gene_type:complete
MSSAFDTQFVQDSVISDVTDKLSFAVRGGASSTTYQSFPAASSSNSSLTFSIQVPSENIIVARDAMIESRISCSLLLGSADTPLTLTNGVAALDWGNSTSFSAFPVSKNMNTANVQINNTSTSVNLKDILPQLLRLNDSRYLYKHNGYAPSMPDQTFYDYDVMAGTNSNPMGSYNNAGYDVDLIPRGAFPVELLVEHFGDDGVNGMVYVDTSLTSASTTYTAGEYWIVNVVSTVTEPIFVSPFTWSAPEHNAQGMLGINNMAMNFTIDSSIPRMVSNGNENVTSVVAGDSRTQAGSVSSNLFLNSRVLLKFLSTQDTDRLASKNVVPYTDFPRYITNQFNSGSALASKGTVTATSNNIQLNQLPDYFIICVRKQMSTQGPNDSDSFLKITSATFNLNNMSGLLSTATNQDLWKLSSKCGSTQNFQEFGGGAWDNASQSVLATTGSLLVISPVDLSLPAYLAPGSLGNFQLSLTLAVENQSDAAVTAELVVIAVNSGFMVTEQGQSSIYTGILTREAVLDAKGQKPVSSEMVERMIGGKMGNRVCSLMHSTKGGMVTSGAGSSGGGKLSGLY